MSDMSDRVLRIVSDGTPGNTRVINPETGEEIPGIIDVTWYLSSREKKGTVNFGEAVIQCYASVDVIGALFKLPARCSKEFSLP